MYDRPSTTVHLRLHSTTYSRRVNDSVSDYQHDHDEQGNGYFTTLLLAHIPVHSTYQWIQRKINEPMPTCKLYCFNTSACATSSTHSNLQLRHSPLLSSQPSPNTRDYVIRPMSVSPYTITSDSMLSPTTPSIDTATETSQSFDLFADYDLVPLVFDTKRQTTTRSSSSRSDYNPRRCPWPNCNHVASRKRDLRRHAQTHAKDSPRYGCPTCGKSFSRYDVMMRHQKKTCNR